MVHRYWWDLYNWWFVFFFYRTSVFIFKPSWTIIVRSSTNVSSFGFVMGFYWPCFGIGAKSVGKFTKQSYILKKKKEIDINLFQYAYYKSLFILIEFSFKLRKILIFSWNSPIFTCVMASWLSIICEVSTIL